MAAKKTKTFDDKDVVATKITMTMAGNVLTKSLEVTGLDEPHIGDTVFIVGRTTIASINHKRLDKGSTNLERVVTLSAEVLTIVDEQAVAELIADFERRLRAIAGTPNLDDEQRSQQMEEGR